ncbi:hypothetical protein [Alloyangia pacifica]|uniref:Lipoprotein n=1 Tax=Alloyangia pacifica TaxID=311180 RepID=A0A1I6SGT6_9RHOB|nr:hypothetical protein [Alloyangia pacifica]SDG79367.1 hypothetical protein SAMN04488245_104372 [Alloyangia pacifica]SFS76162.1 hypothetical protein SAMN04488050_104372 [Alloyangia pacifica]
MVSSSKILTVSYGTFSCTAEGFEDPLGVVKDTTQFFRGVVREDRFFGAEPPQFDPELAAQLLQAQVDAEAQGGRLVLRGPLADVATPAPASVAPVVSSEPVIGPDADRGMEDALASTAARVAAEAEAEIALAAEQEVDLPGEDSLAAEAAFFAAEAGQGSEADYDYEEADFAVSGRAGASLADPARAAHDLPEDEAMDSVAAKLRRIRAVVSGGAAASPALAEETGDDLDESAEAEDGADTIAAVSAMLGALASDDSASRVEEEETEEPGLAESLIEATDAVDDEAPEPVEALATSPAPLALTPDLAAQPEPAVATPTAETPAAEATDAAPRRTPRRVRVVKVTRAAFDTAVASGQLEKVDEPKPSSSLSAEDEAELARELEAVKAELAAGLEDEWDEVEDLDSLSAAPGAELPVEAEAVLADLEAETAEAGNWDDADWDDAAWDESGEVDTATVAAEADEAEHETPDFDDEEDADFAAAFDEPAEQEAAELQVDELEDAISRMATEDVRKAVKLSSPARVMLTEQSVKDNDASRILDETNTQMEEPEGNRRRSAIAHLRAAVAATRADRLLGRKKDAEAQAQPYREDLADVVRPRRPSATTRSERPVEEAPQRPAPLKLVAEQRVDESVEQVPAAPLRPRRVTLADVDGPEGEGQGGFADYAESVGAHDLPELLEAAASYLSYVEGCEQFSRPQLMTKVRQVEGQDSSREDRLRSFGQLLRDGKIEKTGGGRFTVSDRISFKPSARAAG